MERPNILSGEEIVARGITKRDATLPEIGLKDVAPNGSWLEQKQIQAALEARKHLIEIERIEKCGTLSHAEWREDLMLAEVTQKVGGHWQYIGHNVGKKLFLRPEEALFLIEVNSLQLKHNDVTVSLQKAYSLLLNGTISIVQYKVYASLSRLGFKVLRHKDGTTNKEKHDAVTPVNREDNKSESIIGKNDETGKTKHTVSEESKGDATQPLGDDEKMDCVDTTNQQLCDSDVFTMNDNMDYKENEVTNIVNEATKNSAKAVSHSEANGKKADNNELLNDTTRSNHNPKDTDVTIHNKNDIHIIDTKNQPCNVTKLQKLYKREFKPTDAKTVHKYFENIPDLFKKQVVTINVPDQDLLPKNVFVNKSSYMLNLQNIRMKSVRPVSTESGNYSVTDEVNGDHVRRIRSTSGVETPLNSNPYPHTRFPRQNFNFRPYNWWRPQNNLNYHQFGMFFHRPYFPNMFFIPRFHYGLRPNYFQRQTPGLPHFNPNRRNSRKRSRNSLKYSQLQGIKALAARFKQLIMSGNTQIHNQSLQRLLHTYNMKYGTRLRLTENFDVINDETIIETIELEDDEESKRKKPRLDEPDNTYEENLNKLRQLASELRNLEHRNKATARHRRAFSNAVKTFNKAYNADVYFTSKYEVLDRRHINLDSSSESDCVVEEPAANPKGKKLLRNPFNILKRLSEKMVTSSIPTTSKDNGHSDPVVTEQETKYSEHIRKTFNKSWLPNEDDFGRAEVVPKALIHSEFADSCKFQFLFDFMNDHHKKYNNWLEAKISFLKHIDDANIAFQQNKLENDVQESSYTGLRPLIGTDDRLDMPSVLEKLRIIKNNKDIDTETSLRIDFDVYNRDVPNFKKTNPPKPHFRIICMNENTSFPSAAAVSALHAKYNDNVAILFGIVGIDSVSYLQVNPMDLPIYIPNNDLV